MLDLLPLIAVALFFLGLLDNPSDSMWPFTASILCLLTYILLNGDDCNGSR